MSKPVMGCGHSANATRDGQPVCVVCFGIVEGADTVAVEQPDLSNRQALCTYARPGQDTHRGKHTASSQPVPSGPGLAFFNHRPDQPYDDYYCGCWGWD